MTIGQHIVCAVAITFVAGCTASYTVEPDPDSGTDAARVRPDSALLDAGVPVGEDAGPRVVFCGGRECAAAELCCSATGACYDPASPGACVLTVLPPPESGSGTPCASDADCEPSQFCRVAEGSCIGAGWCFGRHDPGIRCTGDAPVCACDGRTYASVCDAYAAGTSVSGAGMGAACGSGPSGAVACGNDSDCPVGRNCCARTSLCTDPACIECCAAPPPGSELGCSTDSDCRALADPHGVSDYFCFGTGCGAGGGCVRPVSACSGALVPVCGCDGVAYANACWAQAARTRIAHSGMCP